MKKVSLMILGLAFAFAGLQSFVQNEVETSEKTVITAANDNWSNDATDVIDGVYAPDWYVISCTTPQGLSGTRCALVNPNGNPSCTGSKNKVACSSNS